jgi:hypothetical protein
MALPPDCPPPPAENVGFAGALIWVFQLLEWLVARLAGLSPPAGATFPEEAADAPRPATRPRTGLELWSAPAAVPPGGRPMPLRAAAPSATVDPAIGWRLPRRTRALGHGGTQEIFETSSSPTLRTTITLR